MVASNRPPSSPTPFRVIGKSRVSQSIVDQILESILTGAYAPGDVFLSERALAEEFQVGRGSVREALRILEFAGVLEIKVGSGTHLTDDALSKVTLMRAHAAAVGDKSPLDIIVTRICVEPTSARLAAQLHKPSDLDVMQEHLRHHRALVEANEDPSEPDVQFHRAMGAACKNTVLSAIVDQLVQMMHESTWSELKGKSRMLDGHAVQALEDHEAIFAAIVDKDGDRAADATEAHLRRIESGLFQAYEIG
jgi:GntR family transcriptional repressor for pyruvate dehydrogenase complex